MTRKSMIKAMKERVRYYRKKGIEIDLNPEALSTQKLTALSHKQGRAFLNEVNAAVVTDGVVESYVVAHAREFEAKQRAEAIRALEKRVQRFQEQGYGIDMNTLNIEGKTTAEINRLREMSARRFIEQTAAYVDLVNWAPRASGPSEIRITIEELRRMERAQRRASAARKKALGEPLDKNVFFTTRHGFETYTKGLERMSEPGYFEWRNDILYENYMTCMRDLAKFDPRAEWLTKELESLGKDYVLTKLIDGIRMGGNFSLMANYDSHDHTGAASFMANTIRLMGIKDTYSE